MRLAVGGAETAPLSFLEAPFERHLADCQQSGFGCAE